MTGLLVILRVIMIAFGVMRKDHRLAVHLTLRTLLALGVIAAALLAPLHSHAVGGGSPVWASGLTLHGHAEQHCLVCRVINGIAYVLAAAAALIAFRRICIGAVMSRAAVPLRHSTARPFPSRAPPQF